MGKRRILSLETITDICRMFRNGEGYELIKEKYRMSQRLIRQILETELGDEYQTIAKRNKNAASSRAGKQAKGRPNPNVSIKNKGRKPWNKGMTMSDEFCEKISQVNERQWQDGTRTHEKASEAAKKAAITKRANGKMAEHSINHSKWMLEHAPRRGIKTSLETRQKQREAKLKFYQNGGISPRLGKKMPPHVSELARKRALKMWEDGKFKFSVNSFCRSKLEIAIFTAISSHHDDAIHSFRISNDVRTFVFDVFVPSQNLLIEINGDYWHANPKIYNIIDDAHKYKSTSISEIRARDALKISVAQSLGYKTLVIWQSEINDFDPALLSMKSHT